MTGAFTYFENRKGADGLSYRERELKQREELWDILDHKDEARLLRDIESENVPCIHFPDCPGVVCKDTIEARKVAEIKYQKTMAELDAEIAQKSKKPVPTNGPSTLKSKSAATALSQSKATNTAPKAAPKTNTRPTKPRPTMSLAAQSKKPPVPTNPSSMRHNAAVAASKTTLGYAKGRSTSATIRKSVIPAKDPEVPDTSLAPALYIQRYGVPKLGTEMWLRCKRAGCFDEDEEPSLEEMFSGDQPNALDKLIREQAEQEFELTFDP